MGTLLVSEWERMWARKKTKILLPLFVLLVVMHCIWLWLFKVGLYNVEEESVYLDALNFSPFVLKEVLFVILFVYLPILLVDSINGEYQSGGYRMVLLRPHSRIKLLFAKWVVLSFVLFGMLGITLLISILFGHLSLPIVQSTSFLGQPDLDFIRALIYIVQYYGLALLILLGIVVLGSLISIVMPNGILSYIGIIAVLIGSIYVSFEFKLFMFIGETVFTMLGKSSDYPLFYPIILSTFFVGGALSLWIWKTRDKMA